MHFPDLRHTAATKFHLGGSKVRVKANARCPFSPPPRG
ncbi:hypothetical protein BQ8794_50276 [Mesorhizobium prunaredense]|uniref:Uncharacterized protein n=1 Tax=Mesorhizobium prunaredense TaxID=1631249 RepID=A0A1R3VEC7_9HYPH|nr:hypothetical protein BQ8794_50276 [Mesorhizobium prunaredense]